VYTKDTPRLGGELKLRVPRRRGDHDREWTNVLGDEETADLLWKRGFEWKKVLEAGIREDGLAAPKRGCISKDAVSNQIRTSASVLGIRPEQ